MASQRRYDLILMDMQMPRMGGLEATAAIRAHPTCASTPILALTANAFHEDRQACIEAGMSGFITKPVEPAALYTEILEQLRGTAVPLPAGGDSNSMPSGGSALDARLQMIKGLDASLGLRSFAGHAGRYRNLLAKMVAGGRFELAQLVAAFENGDFKAAQNHAHSMRGAAGAVGALELQDALQALELSLRNGDPDRKAASHLAWVRSAHEALASAVEALPLA